MLLQYRFIDSNRGRQRHMMLHEADDDAANWLNNMVTQHSQNELAEASCSGKIRRTFSVKNTGRNSEINFEARSGDHRPQST